MKTHIFLKKHGIEPDLLLDQCFMSDEKIINEIINGAGLEKTDVVLEIGAGTGILTKKMMYKVKRVDCVEIDPKLCLLLKELFKNKNVTIINQDVKKHGLKNYRIIISNLPYTIIDWFFKQLINHDFEKAIITISKKAHNKIIKDELFISFLKIRKVCDVPRTSFYPAPKNDSVLLFIIPNSEESSMKSFYEENKDKKVKEFTKDFNERILNKKVRDLSGKQIQKIL